MCAQTQLDAEVTEEQERVARAIPVGGNTDYCFTAYLHSSRSICPSYVKHYMWYLIWQVELTKTGRMHFQGYVQFRDKMTYKQAARHMGITTLKLHLERCYAISKQAADYCKKEDTRVDMSQLHAAGYGHYQDLTLEQGFLQPRMPETRPDLVYYMHLKNMGKSDADLIDNSVVSEVLSKRSNLNKVVQSKNTIARRAYIVWGAGGVGKSMVGRIIAKLFKRYMGWGTYYKDNTKWWELYSGEEIVMINEFDGSKNMSWQNFKLLIDKCPLILEQKNGKKASNIKSVLLISNVEPRYWYANILCSTPSLYSTYELPNELTRRIPHVYKLGKNLDRFDKVIGPTPANMNSSDPVVSAAATQLAREQALIARRIAYVMHRDYKNDLKDPSSDDATTFTINLSGEPMFPEDTLDDLIEESDPDASATYPPTPPVTPSDSPAIDLQITSSATSSCTSRSRRHVHRRRSCSSTNSSQKSYTHVRTSDSKRLCITVPPEVVTVEHDYQEHEQEEVEEQALYEQVKEEPGIVQVIRKPADAAVSCHETQLTPLTSYKYTHARSYSINDTSFLNEVLQKRLYVLRVNRTPTSTSSKTAYYVSFSTIDNLCTYYKCYKEDLGKSLISLDEVCVNDVQKPKIDFDATADQFQDVASNFSTGSHVRVLHCLRNMMAVVIAKMFAIDDVKKEVLPRINVYSSCRNNKVSFHLVCHAVCTTL